MIKDSVILPISTYLRSILDHVIATVFFEIFAETTSGAYQLHVVAKQRKLLRRLSSLGLATK